MKNRKKKEKKKKQSIDVFFFFLAGTCDSTVNNQLVKSIIGSFHMINVELSMQRHRRRVASAAGALSFTSWREETHFFFSFIIFYSLFFLLLHHLLVLLVPLVLVMDDPRLSNPLISHFHLVSVETLEQIRLGDVCQRYLNSTTFLEWRHLIHNRRHVWNFNVLCQTVNIFHVLMEHWRRGAIDFHAFVLVVVAVVGYRSSDWGIDQDMLQIWGQSVNYFVTEKCSWKFQIRRSVIDKWAIIEIKLPGRIKGVNKIEFIIQNLIWTCAKFGDDQSMIWWPKKKWLFLKIEYSNVSSWTALGSTTNKDRIYQTKILKIIEINIQALIYTSVKFGDNLSVI